MRRTHGRHQQAAGKREQQGCVAAPNTSPLPHGSPPRTPILGGKLLPAFVCLRLSGALDSRGLSARTSGLGARCCQLLFGSGGG
jgi:hypothetical protein